MSKFLKKRWDKITTHIAESFNVWLRYERHQKIYMLLFMLMDKLLGMLDTHVRGTEKWKSVVGPKTEENLMSNIMRSSPITVMPIWVGRLRCLLEMFIWLWICSNISVRVWHGKCLDCHVYMYVLWSAYWDTMCMSISTHVLMSPLNIWFTRVSFNHYQCITCPKFVRMGLYKMMDATYFLVSNPRKLNVL